MNFKNIIWLAAILTVFVGTINIFAEEEPKKDEMTTVSGVVYAVLDDQGRVKSVEVRDEKGTAFPIHAQGRGMDLLRLVDAKVSVRGSMVNKNFHILSYEATLGIAGKLVEREKNYLIFEEIAFVETPREFRVQNRKEEVENLGIPFNKEIKANGVISIEGFAIEANIPQDATKIVPEDKKNLPVNREKVDAQREGTWTIRLASYEPLEYIVGTVNSEKVGAMFQVRLEEEEKGIIFKEKGRVFEISNMGKGSELRNSDGAKVKAYGTLSKNQQGNWLLHILAYQKEADEKKAKESAKEDKRKNE